jgi:hypothetical protein
MSRDGTCARRVSRVTVWSNVLPGGQPFIAQIGPPTERSIFRPRSRLHSSQQPESASVQCGWPTGRPRASVLHASPLGSVRCATGEWPASSLPASCFVVTVAEYMPRPVPPGNQPANAGASKIVSRGCTILFAQAAFMSALQQRGQPHRACAACRLGGAPNRRRYSRLNWDGLSYPTRWPTQVMSLRGWSGLPRRGRPQFIRSRHRADVAA